MENLEKELKKGLDEVSQDIKSMIKDVEAKVEAGDKEKSEELQNALTKFADEKKKLEGLAEVQQKHLDELETGLKEYKEKAQKSNIVTPYEFFKDALTNNAEFDKYKTDRQKFNMVIDGFNIKGDDMTGASNYSGDVVPKDRIAPSPFAAPHREVRARQLFMNGATSSDTLSFVRQSATDNSAAAVAEAAAKPQSEETLSEITEPIQVIAHFFRITNQALNDYAQMASYLSFEGVEGLKDVEDTQILSGSGVSPNLNGIRTQASTTFAGGTDISDDTDIDTMVKAYWQLRALHYMPSFILVPPAKMRDIQLIKATDGQYIYPNFAPVGLNDWAVNGVPVIAHSAMPADTFLIGDGSKATVWDREQVNVRFSEHDATNFTTNKTTIRVEERLAVAVYRPDAFITATFTDAQSTLT